ncbi:hypothetical protein AVEN_77448-1 [Araneus ventricosus]|uniref:G-protein coupled receptors family 1 profile domain-containing protein n=1 Tax=Araneus ventricosus TaxID=182803 RepID=A0A4Y2TW06_ARAVE|nr:hypothetical protein AVEN_77448-1 [Araneus ventricosus]
MANLTDWLNITDVDDYLAAVLGPKRLPLTWLVPLTSVYALTFATGLVGNACTCTVIASNPYMQTATNCYLFNLAIADMLTLICGKHTLNAIHNQLFLYSCETAVA